MEPIGSGFFTCIGRQGHGAPALPATREDWEQLRREPWLKQMCERVKRGDEALKNRLPWWTPHCAEYKGNHRSIADAVRPLRRLMMDFDEKGHTDEIMRSLTPSPSPKSLTPDPSPRGEGSEMTAGQLVVLLVEESVRRGTHVLVELPEGMTAEEAQKLMKEATGFTPDKVVKGVDRCIYMVPEDHTRYVSDKLFEASQRSLTPNPSPESLTPSPSPRGEGSGYTSGENFGQDDARKNYSLPSPLGEGAGVRLSGEIFGQDDARKNYSLPSPLGEGSGVRLSGENFGQDDVRKNYSLPSPLGEGAGVRLFKGIPYSSIISEWWRRNGGEPAEGERNVKLHKLAVNLRAICDNKKEVLMQVMPRFGLSETELKSIVDSACKEEPKGISKMLASIIESLEQTSDSDCLDEVDDAETAEDSSAFEHPLLRRGLGRLLPIGLKESLVGVPVSMHMPVLCSVLPIAAAYADGVRVEYCDGNEHHLGLMSIVRGEQASNKSVCKNAVDVWKRQFDEEDALARKREEEWKDRKKGRKANEKAPEDPKVLIRMVPVTVSCSTLLKRFKNSNGHTLYSFGEELDTLRKTNGAGSWSSKYDIYRLSFDKGEWGQDYNSDQAESGVVKVAYNWTMLGTNGAMRKCFKQDSIENGLSSRILVAEMPDSSFQKMPKFGKRSAEDEARIQEAVTRLRSYTGLLDVPRLRRAIEAWVEEKRVEAAKDIDHVKDVYRKRAAVIGFRCGVIFHLLTGKDKESKACLDFALMMAEYCLSQQIKTFGEALQNQYVDARNECQRYGANHSVFDQLPPSFSREDLRALKHDCSESGLRNVIMRWKRDGWIEPIDRHHWRKVAIKQEQSKTSQCPNVPSSH